LNSPPNSLSGAAGTQLNKEIKQPNNQKALAAPNIPEVPLQSNEEFSENTDQPSHPLFLLKKRPRESYGSAENLRRQSAPQFEKRRAAFGSDRYNKNSSKEEFIDLQQSNSSSNSIGRVVEGSPRTLLAKFQMKNSSEVKKTPFTVSVGGPQSHQPGHSTTGILGQKVNYLICTVVHIKICFY